MKKRWIAVGLFAAICAVAVGMSAMQTPEERTEVNALYAKSDAIAAGKDAPEDAAPKPSDGDAIRYDPENARKSQVADIVAVDTENCINNSIRNQLANHVRSRKAILDQTVGLCGWEYAHNGVMSREESDNFVRVKTDGMIDEIAKEGQ